MAARLRRRADLLDAMTVRRRRRPHVPRGRLAYAGSRSASGPRWWRRSSGYLETIPDDKRFDRELFYDAARRGREVRLRHRQRRAAGVQPAGRGLQPGARQRRGAVDEAGQRPRGEQVRGHRRGRRLLRARGAPHRGQPAGAAGAHRPAARATPTVDGVGVRRLRDVAVRGRPGLGRHHRARRDRRGRRPARPRDRQDPLRLRRGQRPGPRGLPGRGGDRRQPRGPPAQGVHEPG